MEAFYLSEITTVLTSVKISGDEFHHLSKVLRLKSGDEIYVMNGQGLILKCRIDFISKDKAECTVLEEKIFPKKEIKIIAFIPVLKNQERFELVIEKLTELGVDIIQPYYSQRTISKNLRIERCKRILIAAIKQSLNPFLPEFRQPLALYEAINEFKNNSLILLGDPSGKNIFEIQERFKNLDIKNIVLIVGPEGDLTPEEKEILKSLDTLSINLGKYRLRTETAIIHLFSLIQPFIQLIQPD